MNQISLRSISESMRFARMLFLLVAVLITQTAVAQSPDDPQPLDHDVYEIWNIIESRGISDDGNWVYAEMGPENHDNELHVHHVETGETHVIERGSSATFTEDSNYLIALVKPPVMEVREAEHHGDDEPKDELALLSLDTGEITRIPDVASFRIPEESSSHVAYLRATNDEDDDENGDDENGNDEGQPLVLHEIATGAEQSFNQVDTYHFAPQGDWLLYTVDSEEDSGLFVIDVSTQQAQPLMTGEGSYRRVSFDEDGTKYAFLSNRDNDDEVSYTLYQAALGDDPSQIGVAGDSGIPEGYVISDHSSLSFSDDGSRVFFGTAPADRLPRDDDDEDEEFEYNVEDEVDVDVWHWEDDRIQTVQSVQAGSERRRTFQAVAHLDSGNLVQLATEDIPSVSVAEDGNADIARGWSNRPYSQRRQWESPTYWDVYLIDITTGDSRIVLEEVQTTGSLSPDGNYLAWWNREELDWMAQSVEEGSTPINLTQGLPPVYDEIHDRPFPAGPYGSIGWSEDEEYFLVQDRYDIWMLDPSGSEQPQSLTQNMGRQQDIRFDYVQLDPDERHINLNEPILLTAFHDQDKRDGFYRLSSVGTNPEEIVLSEYSFSTPRKAEDAERLLFTRQNFQEFPDLWVSSLDITDMEQITDANPQQENYLWGSAEQVEWRSDNGELLQGNLYRPAEFDPNEEYPMMVYFYERASDNLYSHHAPEPHRSVINISFYTSRGYVVFVPDIVYKEGYPGESALQSIMPGVHHVVGMGFVDSDRVAMQGHSWAGYQIAYMITKTDYFRAVGAGAPVSNMTSAYGQIRWETGRSRMFQYENTQSRIGGTLWEYPNRYWENSPLFYADNINTPLLMMHNDEDGHVPWEQGIEMFKAMRRLGKPAWMISYNEQPHWPITYANKRDWAIRLQQFFDHYLMDEPAPRWMVEGVPAIERDDTLGLEPSEELPSEGRSWYDNE